jgi:4'-phosphopantetheinyl transferase
VTHSSDERRASGQKLAESTTPEAAGLPIDRVDFWIVSLLESGNEPGTTSCLSADERARGERFAFERDRRRFLRGRGALRSILARYLRCGPAEILFEYGDTGKPRLSGTNSADGLQFNASGSADLAVCAVTCGRSVGIDIEQVRDACDPDLVRHSLCEVEREEFEQLPANQQPAVFYRTWTRKEAYLKATGCGLSRPLSSFAVSVSPGDAPRLVRDDLDSAAPASWLFADFDPAPGWVGTLVHSGELRPIRRLDWGG